MEPLPELRSGKPEDRHLIYEGCGIILDLLLKQGRDGTCLHIAGQVLPDDTLTSVSDLPVLIQNGRGRLQGQTNALGEFMFHAVSDGAFDLSIELRNCRFEVRGLSRTDLRRWTVVPTATGGAV
jgi:hypothetical protein